MRFKSYMPKFKVGDIIVPIYLTFPDVDDLRRKVLKVGKTEYTIQFLGGNKKRVKWLISGTDGDHIKEKK